MGRPSLIRVILVALVLTTGVRLAAAEDPSGAGNPRPAPPNPMEFLDDPPATPAQPVPGASPALRPRFGRHASVQVNVAPGGANIPGDASNEPTLAVDPTNPQRMAIGFRHFTNVTSNFRQAGFAYTEDGGRHWTFPGVLTPGIFRSDPVFCADAEGNFYYLSLKSSFTTDVFKSTDGGASWGAPVPAYGGDKEWMTIDRTGGVGHGNIYSDWTASSNDFTRSIDGGASFSPPSTVPSTPQWGSMDVGEGDGDLYLAGVNSNYTSFLVSRSTDAENPLDPSTSFTTVTVNLGGFISYYDAPNPEGLLGQPWVEVDPSNGPTAGYIYVVCSVDPSGADPLDVHFIRSTDHGLTWSAPLRINDDPGTSDWQWFGTMSVAPNGRIDVVWNDTRNTGVENWSELYSSHSTNGGLTWSTNVQLSPSWDSHVGWPNQQKIGDYYHMISDRVGANLAWAATFNGEQDIYFLRIGDYDCNQNGIGDSLDIALGASDDLNQNGILDECEGPASEVADLGPGRDDLSNAPNPFNRSTTLHYEIPDGGGRGRLQIFNAGGQLVRTLLNAEAPAGAHSVVWDGTDDQGRPVSAGLYLYQLETGGMSRARRMLLLR